MSIKEEILIPQSFLIKKMGKLINQLHRQEYLYAMRETSLLIEQMMDMIPKYIEWNETKNIITEQSEKNKMLNIFKELLDAQECEDYIKLADILQEYLYPYIKQVQKKCMKDEASVVYESEKYRIEWASIGNYTIAAKQSNRWKYMHSKEQPFSESDSLAKEWFDGENYEYIVYGLGLGYHIQALLDIDETITVKVYETDKEIMELEKRYGVIDREINKERLKIIYDPKLKKMVEEIAQSNKKKLVVYYPSMLQVENDFFRSKLENYFISYSSMKTQLTRLTGNFLVNQKEFTHEVTELASEFNDKTVYIIAAGPSLDHNIMRLKNKKKGDIILATGTVLKKLLSVGITPDYVIIIDGGAFTYLQTRDLQETKVPLLYLSTVYYKIPQEYPGVKYFICQQGFKKSEEYANSHQYPVYATGGSVTTTALEICIRMKCKKVVFVGLDLAYTGMKNHASDTADVQVERRGNMMVEDIYGKMINTAKNLNIYRLWIEDRINMSDAGNIEFIDATEGGAKINGCKIDALANVIGS